MLATRATPMAAVVPATHPKVAIGIHVGTATSQMPAAAAIQLVAISQ
jgi:hypothetical protein